MSSQDLEGTYIAALARISALPVPNNARKYTPIFHRDELAAKKQAMKDAANALGALWKKRANAK